jgi:uncharacterized protein YbjT (DUF2867 family)
MRPSVIFGPDDKFLNTLISATRWCPVLALFGAGKTRLQPVYLGDVAEAALRALTTPSSRAKVFELGGPKRHTFSQRGFGSGEQTTRLETALALIMREC